jgi:hypothetical protein
MCVTVEDLADVSGCILLDLIKHLFERNEVPLDCVPEALGCLSKVMNESSFDK